MFEKAFTTLPMPMVKGMVEAQMISGARSHDPRHLFPLGTLNDGNVIVNAIASAMGSETNARFALGEMLHRHLCGDHGPVSDADAAINQFVLDHLDRDSKGKHCVVSEYKMGGILVQIITDLEAHQTVLRARQR